MLPQVYLTGTYFAPSPSQPHPVREEHLVFLHAPTFVIPPTGRLRDFGAFAIVYRNLRTGNNIDLRSEIDRLKRFWLRPWDRLPSLQEMLAAARSQRRSAQRQISRTIFNEWWPLVSDLHHIQSEWQAIIEAWEGAIGFQGDSSTAKTAISPAKGLGFHTRLLDEDNVADPEIRELFSNLEALLRERS
jgi:hypothetical protein